MYDLLAVVLNKGTKITAVLKGNNMCDSHWR